MENNIYILIFCWIANLIGLMQWSMLTLLLMEVVICKDATTVNASRILHKSFIARIKLFQRSFRSLFYKASVGIFFGSIISMFYLMGKLYSDEISSNFYPFNFISLFFPICLYVVYRELGYSSTFFNKLKEFLRNED